MARWRDRKAIATATPTAKGRDGVRSCRVVWVMLTANWLRQKGIPRIASSFFAKNHRRNGMGLALAHENS